MDGTPGGKGNQVLFHRTRDPLSHFVKVLSSKGLPLGVNTYPRRRHSQWCLLGTD